MALIFGLLMTLVACVTGGSLVYFKDFSDETAFERAGREYYNCLVAAYQHSAYLTYEETGTPVLHRDIVELSCAHIEVGYRTALRDMPGYRSDSEIEENLSHLKDTMYAVSHSEIIDGVVLSASDIIGLRSSRFKFPRATNEYAPSITLGDPNARNTLSIVFSPASCGYSARLLQQSLPHLRSMADRGEIFVELIPYARNDLDTIIAALSICSRDEDMAALVTQVAIVGSEMRGERTVDRLIAELRSQGIHIPGEEECPNYLPIRRSISHQREAFRVGYEISVTPTAISNGFRLPEASSWSDLRTLLILN